MISILIRFSPGLAKVIADVVLVWMFRGSAAPRTPAQQPPWMPLISAPTPSGLSCRPSGCLGQASPLGHVLSSGCKSDDHVIHNTQLAAANSGVTSFGWVRATCAALSDSTLR